ncbi:unnamed protein product [Arabidopsis thaliana]|uniref:Uncharacterized protein n=1 Tax=Arabidopsis thaliana TaxID=3702 RepID=A0A5S9XIY6_ARATH|nr:unnamed protein product [Arabidopsis thaliana]
MGDSQEFSEVPDLSQWCSSYIYESPMMDTSDGLVSSHAKDMSQSQIEFSEDIINLVVEDNEIDEDNSLWGKPKRKGSNVFQKPKRKEETTTTYEAELTYLKNRVQYLENEVRILHDLINNFIGKSSI